MAEPGDVAWRDPGIDALYHFHAQPVPTLGGAVAHQSAGACSGDNTVLGRTYPGHGGPEETAHADCVRHSV